MKLTWRICSEKPRGDTNLVKWLSRQSLQNLWPHFVKIGSFSGSLQIANCNSPSTSLTSASSYPPSEGFASASAIFVSVRLAQRHSQVKKMRPYDNQIMLQLMLAVSHIIILPYLTSLLLGSFNNRTATSVDDGARKSNKWLDQRQRGKLGTGSSVQSFPRAFPSSIDVPVLLLDHPINN